MLVCVCTLAFTRETFLTQKCWKWSTENCVFQSSKSMVNYEVVPVVRPILAVEMLSSKRAQVAFGVENNNS